LLAAALVVWAPLAQAASPLHVDGPHLKDAAGRVVVLRGVNVAGNAKVPPFMPAADPAIFEPLEAWGMNVVRLLFTWEAYEPSPGVYDEAYLDYYAGAARAAWERGLYVIVDFHQDAFSRSALGGCGDGFPAWALPPGVTPVMPDNGPDCADWGVKMLSDADQKLAWQSFYADEVGARARYLAMLESVSARLEEEPGVIGYDMMNEPQGDEVAEIGPLYEDAAVALRKMSPSAVLFVSPQARTSAGTQTALVKPSFGNFVYSPHFYDASVILFDSWSGVEPDAPFEDMTGKAAEWGAPLLLGELGAPAETVEGSAYVSALYDRLDEGFASGTQWVYTPGWTEEAKDGWNGEDFSVVDGEGNTRPNFVARPYPRKIAGAPKQFRATVGPGADRRIELEWEHEPETGATELFVPVEALFAGGAVLVEASGDGLTCSLEGDLVTCSSAEPGPKSLVIRKKEVVAPESGSCGLTGIEMLVLWPLAMVARRRARRKRGR